MDRKTDVLGLYLFISMNIHTVFMKRKIGRSRASNEKTCWICVGYTCSCNTLTREQLWVHHSLEKWGCLLSFKNKCNWFGCEEKSRVCYWGVLVFLKIQFNGIQIAFQWFLFRMWKSSFAVWSEGPGLIFVHWMDLKECDWNLTSSLDLKRDRVHRRFPSVFLFEKLLSLV